MTAFTSGGACPRQPESAIRSTYISRRARTAWHHRL